MRCVKVIENAKIVLENTVISDGVLLIDDKRIAAVGKKGEIEIPDGAERIDAKGLYAGPGFVDIHVHGGNGYMFADSPLDAAEFFLNHGETTVLPTLYYNLNKDEFIKAIDRIKNAAEQNTPPGKAIKGIYMEGPYMNPKYGAVPDENKWKGKINEADYKVILEHSGTFAKVWAVAPEREGIEEFVKAAKEANPDAVISAGHSEASPAQIAALKKYNLCLLTHCMNATGYPEREFSGTKNCGPDEACLMDNDMYAELICDSAGIHVPPDLINFVLKLKGVDKVILITDSFVSYEPSPESLSHITDLQFDSNGDLCGSSLTMDVVLKNIIKHTGCSITDAFKMAALNPAKLLDMDKEIGSVMPGKLANLVVMNENFEIKNVIFQGEFIRKDEKIC